MIRYGLPAMPGLTGPSKKQFWGGTHRTMAPEDTFERVRRFMPAMGITRVANVTGLDCIGIPVVVVCRPNSRSLSVSQGKGLTLAAAKVSGLMESVEAFHGETIVRPLLLGSASELGSRHRVTDIYDLPRTSSVPLDDDTPFLWAEGYDVMQGETVWVPYELVHVNATATGRVTPGLFCCSTNGLASGNTLLEAISSGICEVVERDSTAVSGLRPDAERAAVRIDLDTIDDPGCREALDKFAAAGIAVGVWDTTTDVCIPSFDCLIAERTEDAVRALHASGGQGCHPSRAVALLRALTEAAQTRLTVISGARDDLLRTEYDRHRSPDQVQKLRNLALATGGRSFSAAPTFEGETFDDDVCWMLGRLRAAGLHSVIVFDLTKPEFGISVVKVVIPGLEGIHSFPNYVLGSRARRAMQEAA
jgi:ribosomal protein S12 methylthiotransferase accessory factor